MAAEIPTRRGRRTAWWFALGLCLGLIGGFLLGSRSNGGREAGSGDGLRVDRGDPVDGQPTSLTMAEVLQIAEEALERFRANVDDYTATLVKQESVRGSLGEAQRIALKLQCPHRRDAPGETFPLRVYLRFESPNKVAGREVIWAEDQNDGKLVAHEAGLLGLMTVRLDPTGMIAMQGQRYPIYDIGMTNLLEKLVERGRRDLDNPDVQVTRTPGAELDGVLCDLIEVRRRSPSGQPDDFSRVEIWFDSSAGMPIRYSAWGWPAANGSAEEPVSDEDAPLLESYTYLDIRTNVGLTESDFDPANPEYRFR